MAESNDNWICLGNVPCFQDLSSRTAESVIPLYVIKIGNDYMYKTVYNGMTYFISKLEGSKCNFNAIFEPFNEKPYLLLNVPRW